MRACTVGSLIACPWHQCRVTERQRRPQRGRQGPAEAWMVLTPTPTNSDRTLLVPIPKAAAAAAASPPPLLQVARATFQQQQGAETATSQRKQEEAQERQQRQPQERKRSERRLPRPLRPPRPLQTRSQPLRAPPGPLPAGPRRPTSSFNYQARSRWRRRKP